MLIASLVFWSNLAVLVALVATGPSAEVSGLPDAVATLAAASGSVGVYLVLVQFVLVARVPWLDQAVGHPRLTRLHKKNGRWSFGLIGAHVVLAVLARAGGPGRRTALLELVSTPLLLLAGLGFVLLAGAVLTSIERTRALLTRQRWHDIHLWTYGAVAASFGHELLGPDFAGRAPAQAYLLGLHLATATLLVGCRVLVPLVRTLMHQLHVEAVVPESQGVVSVYLRGRGLRSMGARGGQFMYWRFLDPAHFREARPYSLSAAPTDEGVRITVRAIGSGSRSLLHLQKGTWVAFEGPYGSFTTAFRCGRRGGVLLVAGGIGITPVRAMLEELPALPERLVVLYRVRSEQEAILLAEVRQLVEARQGRLELLPGGRGTASADACLTAEGLSQLVPDIREWDVYVCAGEAVRSLVLAALVELRVPRAQVHHETF